MQDGRIARSARLARIAWRLVRTDRTMLALAGVSAALTIAAMMLIFGLTDMFAAPHRGRAMLLIMLAAWPITFLATFLHVGIAAAADARMHGRRLSVREALQVSWTRVGQIALWSLLAAGVGWVLSEIASRVPFGGRLAAWVLGGAWALLTFFAVPVLAIEGCTGAACVKRSAGLIKERWGEGVAGTLGINAVMVVASLVPGAAFGLGFALLPYEPTVGVPLFVFGVVGLLVVMGAANAIRNVFAVALYRFAVDGEPKGGFAEADLRQPFTKPR